MSWSQTRHGGDGDIMKHFHSLECKVVAGVKATELVRSSSLWKCHLWVDGEKYIVKFFDVRDI